MNIWDKIKSYLINERKISPEYLNVLERKWLIHYEESFAKIVMKDLEGEIIGIQERYVEPIKVGEKLIKSKTASNSKVWYFYLDDLNFSLPIVVVEGEMDWLSAGSSSNLVGLQGIHNLKKLLIGLQKKWVENIYILIDNDDPADKAITSAMQDLDIDWSTIYDCRWYLWKHNDLNDYIVAWNLFDFNEVMKSWICLQEFINKNTNGEEFIVRNGEKPKIDHNLFAKYLLKKHSFRASNGALFRCDDGIWKPVHKELTEKIIVEEMEKYLLQFTKMVKTVDKWHILQFLYNHAESETMANKLHCKHTHEINLKDCILDVEKWQFRPYRKSDYKFHKLGYDSSTLQCKIKANPVVWLRFLDDILEGWKSKEKIIEFLQEFFGLMFIPSAKYEQWVLFYGTGANGKGVLLDVLKNIVWEENCSSVGLHEMNKDQNVFLLFGKLVNFDSDMNHNVQLDSSQIKKIVSGESIVGKVVYQKPIIFAPYARLLIATNEMPYIKGSDHSIKRRFVFIHLKQSFIGREDPNLKQKLNEEKEEIFLWAIEGLKRLLKRDRFNIPEDLKNEMDKFIKENDSVAMYLESWSVEIRKDLFIPNPSLYNSYSVFCKRCGMKPVSLRKLGDRLVQKWFLRHNDWKSRWHKWLWWDNLYIDPS